MIDILAENGPLFLGSRLKRLGERLQADAARIVREAGFALQPAHMPLLAAIDRLGPLTVSQAVEALGVAQPTVTRSLTGLIDLGVVETKRAGSDQRHKTISLTAAGRAAVARCKPAVWTPIDAAAAALCDGLEGGLLAQLGMLESRLADRSLVERVAAIGARPGLRIREYDDTLAKDFHDITAEWVGGMFTIEENDRRIIEDPRGAIIDREGIICFVEADGIGIVGTCALIKIAEGCYELTKMGVRESARGRKAGEFLLAHVLARAVAMGIESLYLLTNARCEAAIHLYEKAGFVHDPEIKRIHGTRYARCDVAMRYPL